MKHTDKNNKDQFGRRSDCYFYRRENKRIVCGALIGFYNSAEHYDQCGSCPFFKTEKEFFDSAGIGAPVYDECRA